MHQPEVRVVATAEVAVPILLDEVRRTIAARRLPLLGFATGRTFTPFLQRLAQELRAGTLSIRDFTATHLDEYVGYPPDRAGGMVQELCVACPPLGDMLRAGTFLPVPHAEDAAAIELHAERLRRAGGVALQFVGIGRNGHVAFNEPGTPFDSGFHAAALAEATIEDARHRFRPAEPPRRAVTSGLATILAAHRIVLCAFGAAKAAAVRAMLEGEETPACPATVLRRHGNVLMLLDREAAAGCTSEQQ
jgi:glucosamine-6-phosphate deaminase